MGARTCAAQGQVGGPQEELPEDQDELWKDKHWYRKAGIDAAAASKLLCRRLFELGAQSESLSSKEVLLFQDHVCGEK